jgi:CxxC motif-containing protein
MIEKICISCPVGCHLRIEYTTDAPDIYIISGNGCKRGIEYGENEMRHPMRMATTTVHINGGKVDRLPVKTSTPIPKASVEPMCRFLDQVEINAPVALGDVIVKNIFNSGADVIACRTIEVNDSGVYQGV